MNEKEPNEIDLPNDKKQDACLAEIAELVIDYAFGEFIGDQARDVEEHLIFCTKCQESYLHIKSLIRVVRVSPQEFFTSEAGKIRQEGPQKAMEAGRGGTDG